MNIKKTLIKYRILPTYTEVSLFLILYGFILIMLANPVFAREIMLFLIENGGPYFIILTLGAIFIVYYALNFKKVPGENARTFMIILAIILEIFAAILLFLLLDESYSTFNIVLASFNVFQGLMLFLMLRIELIDESNILLKNAKPKEIIIGMIGTTILFLFINYILKAEFPVTFSILITYAIVFNDHISSTFLKQSPKS